MNQIFNFKRYMWLVKRQWYENAAIYKWGIVLMVMLVILLFWLYSDWKAVDNPRLGQAATFCNVGIAFLYIYGANFFESLSSKYKGMFYFSLPVSSLERVITAFTFVMILMPVLFLSVFLVFDYAFVQLFNNIHNTSEQMFLVKAMSSESVKPFVLLLGCMSFNSIIVLGSLAFGKNGMIKTSLISFFVLLVISFVIFLQIPVSGFFKNIFPWVIPICWIIMYFIMRKKEV